LTKKSLIAVAFSLCLTDEVFALQIGDKLAGFAANKGRSRDPDAEQRWRRNSGSEAAVPVASAGAELHRRLASILQAADIGLHELLVSRSIK